MSYIFHEDILEVSSLNKYKFVSWYCLKVFLKQNKYLIIALWYGRAVIWSNQGIQERWLVLEVRVQRSLLLAFVSLASGIESGNQICIWNSMKWISWRKTCECMCKNQHLLRNAHPQNHKILPLFHEPLLGVNRSSGSVLLLVWYFI